MRAVAYVRVSSPSQVEGHSLDGQEHSFQHLCKNKGWEPGKVYREEGKSAHVDAISKRPVFRQLLDDASKHQFDIIVVHTLDRWARNQRIMLETFSTLAKHNVSLVSITENIDYSTPQGKLFTQMLGSFAEYFSGALATHVKKGLDQRAREGKHNGTIPFGYESCWIGEKGQKKLRCIPEHNGGIHIVLKEGSAIAELFNRYASGHTTLSQLAGWLNEQGFKTRNTHKLPNPQGDFISGPRLFTTASVRSILHNSFYTGQIVNHGKNIPGKHEPLVSQELFENVQVILKRNSGRSETLQLRPERFYLLKGLLRCTYCGMPMWAQTYRNKQRYYREIIASRSHYVCPAQGRSIRCEIVEELVIQLVKNLKLNDDWLTEVLSIINLKDEVERVKKQRNMVQEKLRRMAKVYTDGLFSDDEYHRQKKLLELELESLVIPKLDAAEEAGKLIFNLPELWKQASQEEKRRLLLTIIDAIYIDTKNPKIITAIQPKSPFSPIFQIAIPDTITLVSTYAGFSRDTPSMLAGINPT